MPLYELLFSADGELLRLGLHASRIWKLSLRELSVNVLPQSGIANGVAPIDYSLLQTVIHFLKPCRNIGEVHGAVKRTGERIGQLVICNIRPYTPVGARAI